MIIQEGGGPALVERDVALHSNGADIIVGALLSIDTPLSETWILDVGRGDGAHARAMIDLVGHIDAFAPQPDSLEPARARLARYERRGRVAFHHGDLFALPFEDGTFDAVMVHQALHLVEDGVGGYPGHARVLGELNRVLRPGGVLIANVSTHRQLRKGFWFHDLLPRAAEAALKVCISGPRLETMLDELGFWLAGRTVPLDLLVGEADHRDGHPLLAPGFRRMFPAWELAPGDEAAAALDRIRALIDSGELSDFVAAREEGRRRYGQFTFFVAHKPE